jgi:hypothetical protein
MSLVVLFGAGLMLGGLLFCFAGERMFRFFLVLCAAAAGVYAGLLLASAAPSLIRVIAAVLGGILGGALALLLYRVSFLLAGCAAGWCVASVLLGLGPLVSALAAIATGLLGFLGARYFMALATAVWGGAAAAAGASMLAGRLAGFSPAPVLVLAAAGALAIPGAVVQIAHLRRSSGS